MNNNDNNKIYDLNLAMMAPKSQLCRSKPHGA